METGRITTDHRRPSKGSTIVVVIWSLAIAAVITAALQVISFRQATIGREQLAQVQARWAARAGVEQMIAIMGYYTENPEPENPMQMVDELENYSVGEVLTGSWDIRHYTDGQEWAGPMDEHGKANINLLSSMELLNLPDMTADVADSIIDWMDENDEVEGMGAEEEYYINRSHGYTPRNAPFRSIAEVELVAGAWPEFVRGEDWNFNNRLDPNEDDGNTTWPPDDPDGILQEGWAAMLTTYSIDGGMGMSGLPRLNLKEATSQEMMGRLDVDEAQAAALSNFAGQDNAQLASLLIVDLADLADTGNSSSGTALGNSMRSSAGTSGQSQQEPSPLTDDQLRLIFQESTLATLEQRSPGKVNVNTASAAVLEDLVGFEPDLVNGIIALRENRLGGITSLVDLLEVSGMEAGMLASMGAKLDVISNVFTISSKGRAFSTGTEVEMVVVVDRSTLPVKILAYREQ